jgi:hypothetical protein
MGRVWQQSNPTEINSAWLVSGDDAAGIYYTQQTYDWKGRPLVTTNPDCTTKQLLTQAAAVRWRSRHAH